MSINACMPREDGNRLVEPLLEQVDCQVAHYVEQIYASMFGPFGFLEPVLTGALTLYIAFYGYQLMTGRGSLSLSGLAPKILTIGLVLAFATRWGAYQAIFLNIFYGGADQLAALMMAGANNAGVQNVSAIARLDGVLQEIIRIAQEWNQTAITDPAAVPLGPTAEALAQSQGEQAALPRTGGAVNLLWFSAILLALSTVGILIIAKILLGLLLAVGPVLVVTALFSTTRGLFEGWLKTLALYALVAAFATVLAGGVLFLVEPMVSRISDLRASGSANPQPVFVLAVTVFVFSLLMLQLLRMCGRLTGSWRIMNVSEKQATQAAPAAPVAQTEAQGVSRRVADMVVAVERSGGAGNDNRTRNVAAAANYAAPAQSIASSMTSRRTSQRYQSFGSRLGARGRFA